MLSVSKILLFAVAVSGAAIETRDAAKVIADLKVINGDNSDLNTAVSNYNGGGAINALPIISAANKLDDDIKSTTTDVNNSAPPTDSEAQQIIDYINSTLEPGIATTVGTLKSKKPFFDQDGLTSSVKAQLETLKTDTDSLADALIAKAPANRVDDAKASKAKIDDDFTGAIAFFS